MPDGFIEIHEFLLVKNVLINMIKDTFLRKFY